MNNDQYNQKSDGMVECFKKTLIHQPNYCWPVVENGTVTSNVAFAHNTSVYTCTLNTPYFLTHQGLGSCGVPDLIALRDHLFITTLRTQRMKGRERRETDRQTDRSSYVYKVLIINNNRLRWRKKLICVGAVVCSQDVRNGQKQQGMTASERKKKSGRWGNAWCPILILFTEKMAAMGGFDVKFLFSIGLVSNADHSSR